LELSDSSDEEIPEHQIDEESCNTHLKKLRDLFQQKGSKVSFGLKTVFPFFSSFVIFVTFCAGGCHQVPEKRQNHCGNLHCLFF